MQIYLELCALHHILSYQLLFVHVRFISMVVLLPLNIFLCIHLPNCLIIYFFVSVTGWNTVLHDLSCQLDNRLFWGIVLAQYITASSLSFSRCSMNKKGVSVYRLCEYQKNVLVDHHERVQPTGCNFDE